MSALYFNVHNPSRDLRRRMNENAALAKGATKFTNQKRAARNDYPGEGSARLSNKQMAQICILAKAAFEHVLNRAPHDAAELEAWRRHEQQLATGKPSLTVCLQSDYNGLISHLADLAGETGLAANAEIKAATGPKRTAMMKLEEACRENGRHISYPAAICRNQFKCRLEDATPQQLWRLVFTVKNRGPAKGMSEVGGQKPAGTLPAKLQFTKTGGKPAPAIDEPF